MRLLVLTPEWRCRMEASGYVKDWRTIQTLEGSQIRLEPSDRVLTPVTAYDEEEGARCWLLNRSSKGEVTLVPTPSGDVVYFEWEAVHALSLDPQFFPALFEGNNLFFLELREPDAPPVAPEDDGELTYEEDGAPGPDDSFGPADTIIVP